MTVAVAGTPTVAGATGPVNAITISKPSGVSDGDLLIAVLRGSTSGATSDWALSGWTRASSTTFTANDSTSRLHGIYYKLIPSAAAETATSYTFTYAGTAGRVTGQIFRVTGADPSTPIQVASVPYDATGVTNGFRVDSLTATGPGLFIVTGSNEVVSPNADTATTPSGFTVITSTESVSGTAATRSVTASFYEAIASAGATGNVNVVWVSQSGGNAEGVIINPASGIVLSVSGTSSQTLVDTPSVPVSLTVSGSSSMGTATGSSQTQSVSVSGTSSQTLVVKEAQAQTLTVSGTSSTRVSTGPVQKWLKTSPLYVAHFGGDADWPPGLVLHAYQLADRWNADLAFEVDVWPTTDGVWVVQHDNTTDTNFGTSGNVITSSTWASISSLTTTVGGYPIMRLETLLAAFPNRAMMIDNKGQLSMPALLNLLDTYGGSSNFLTKGYCTSTSWADAGAARGYGGWGYYYDTDIASNLPATQSHWSMLGMDVVGTSTSADWTALKSYGKPVLAHIVATAAQKATGAGLGADGYMASGVQEVVPQTPQQLAVSGSGSQSLTALERISIATSVSGSSSQTLATSQSISTSATVNGTGTQTVQAGSNSSITGAVSGSGTQSLSLTQGMRAALGVSGTGTQSIATLPREAIALTVAGFGSVTAGLSPGMTQSLSVSGVGVLTAATLNPERSFQDVTLDIAEIVDRFVITELQDRFSIEELLDRFVIVEESS